jgi:hypothetical protein
LIKNSNDIVLTTEPVQQNHKQKLTGQEFNTHKSIFQLLPIFIVSMLVLGCRKDSDNEYPEIQIQSPNAQSVYQYNDDLPIKITFTDNIILQEISIELVNLTDMRVFSSSRLFPDQAAYNYNESITLNDRYWPSGQMFMRVIASDGTHTTTQIQEFYYGEAPIEIEDEWRVISNNPGYSIFNQHDQLIHSDLKEYACGGYEPRTGKYWLAHTDGSLINRSINADYTLSTFLLSTFPSCCFYDPALEKHFIGGENGNIWTWQNGNIQSLVSDDNKKVRQISSRNGNLFVWKEEPVTGQDYVFVYNIDSGVLINAIVATFNIESISEFNSNQIVVTGNENNQAKFGFIQSNSEVISQNFTLTETSPIQKTWPALDGAIWALHETGLIFYHSGLSYMQVINGIHPIKIITDKSNHQYRVITTDYIYAIDSQLNNSLLDVQKNIIDYFILYNK